mmetsp:Transcript_104278/g.264818  ORF Transcript_104278/g.264818 Transcript_104278/m.264818 type:complete len:108 (-) Transcript_104278:16-339(-)
MWLLALSAIQSEICCEENSPSANVWPRHDVCTQRFAVPHRLPVEQRPEYFVHGFLRIVQAETPLVESSIESPLRKMRSSKKAVLSICRAVPKNSYGLAVVIPYAGAT